MCGIAGAVGFIDNQLIETVNKVSVAMLHRGPDGNGLWSTEANAQGVILAHRRLSIIDLTDSSAQPMVDTTSGCVLSYNGEIYNFQSVKKRLVENGHTFASSGDTEVILKAYLEWGKDCVSYFDGMFAFAVFDPRTKEIFLARDPAGIKPLYYSTISNAGEPNTIIFASELKALLASDRISPSVNPDALSTYLWNGFVVEPLTIIKGISLLEAGHSLTISSAGHCSKTRYSDIFESSAQSSDYPKEFSSTVEEIVQQHLQSDVPIGVFLSGGVDSSLIAIVAAGLSDQPINTFNISFSESEYSEAEYAKKVAEAIGSNHHEVKLTERAFEASLENALEALDQPSFDGINTYFVSHAVADQNIKVALAGTGGDELFGGYRSFSDIPTALSAGRFIKLLPRSLRKRMGSLYLRLLHRNKSFPMQSRWGKMLDILISKFQALDIYQITYCLFTSNFLSQLSPKYWNRASLGLSNEMHQEISESIPGKTQLQAISLMEQKLFLGQRLLRDTDAVSMSASLEVRVPLVGKRISRLAQSVPDEIRFFPKRKKQILRNLISKDLPPGFFDRPKSGFELPMEKWLKNMLTQRGTEIFSDKTLIENIGLNSLSVEVLWHAFLNGEKGIYWSRVWSLYVLLWWCKSNNVKLD